MTEPLADRLTVETALGRKLDSEEVLQVEHLIAVASNAFASAARISFGAGTQRVRLISQSGMLSIRQPGVTEIQAVQDDDGTPLDYQWDKDRPQVVTTRTETGAGCWVSYAYNYTPPKTVGLRIAEIVKRTLMVPKNAQAGLTQFSETKGPFTRSGTYATWAVGGQTLLSPEDLRLARSLRFEPNARVIGMIP